MLRCEGELFGEFWAEGVPGPEAWGDGVCEGRLQKYLGKNFVSSGHICDIFCLAQPKLVNLRDKTMYVS